MVSKYIGETEKNLSRIFHEAETSNCILLFDEADSIFGKRSTVKDARDRYANIETSYLLQKIEEYEGIVILTTNLLGNIDSAFLRRIKYIVHFPKPDRALRERIWRNVWPQDAPLEKGINYGYLAKKFELSGGNIKNAALAAAFLAAKDNRPVNNAHISLALRRETSKLGEVIPISDYSIPEYID